MAFNTRKFECISFQEKEDRDEFTRLVSFVEKCNEELECYDPVQDYSRRNLLMFKKRVSIQKAVRMYVHTIRDFKNWLHENGYNLDGYDYGVGFIEHAEEKEEDYEEEYDDEDFDY